MLAGIDACLPRPSLTLQPDHERQLDLEHLGGRDDAFRYLVTLDDATKDVHQDHTHLHTHTAHSEAGDGSTHSTHLRTTHIAVTTDDLKGILHFLSAGIPSNVKEICRLSSVVLDQVQRGHG